MKLDPIAPLLSGASSRARAGLKVLTMLALGGCAVAGDEDQLATNQAPSWEDFRDETYRETFEDGHYIVNGDIAIADEKNLLEFWEGLTQGGLIVNTSGGQDTRWSDTQKLNLTYCVSTNFGANRTAVITALNAATANWESRGNVNFVHVTAEDSNCTASNPNVLFDVRQVSGQPYLARAFFPGQARSSRNVLVDSSSFAGGLEPWDLDDIIAHELGHVLGFRHEHTRPEAGTCFEDNNWRPLTPYDSVSIMHYPQCNGGSGDLEFSARDTAGIQALYGAPGGGPVDPPPTGTPATQNYSGTLTGRQTRQLIPAITAKAGTTLTVTLSSTTTNSDVDLYVRFGSAPTSTAYSCRPYLNGSNETCTLTVPTTATTAYIMVNNYKATTANFAVVANYTQP